MTCDAIQNRLLALPDPARPSAALRGHLDACPACRAVQAEAVRIERLVKGLPVPSSEARKRALLESLDAGPVIRTKPVAPSARTGSGAFRPVGRWLATVDLRWVGGVAAAAAVAAGVWWAANRPPEPVPEVAEKPRHDLLARTVRHTTALSNATTPPARLAVFADWSADLTAEACGVYKVAAAEEMNSLARQYVRAVEEGVHAQAKLVDDKPMDVGERKKLFDAAIARLAAAETDADRRAQDAPADARPALQKIAAAAKKGRTSLTEIVEKRKPVS
jgi:hypothetical protein